MDITPPILLIEHSEKLARECRAIRNPGGSGQPGSGLKGGSMDATLRGYTLDFIKSMLTEESGKASGWFQDLELKSVFQPAFSLPQKHDIGFEASLRAVGPDGKPVS